MARRRIGPGCKARLPHRPITGLGGRTAVGPSPPRAFRPGRGPGGAPTERQRARRGREGPGDLGPDPLLPDQAVGGSDEPPGERLEARSVGPISCPENAGACGAPGMTARNTLLQALPSPLRRIVSPELPRQAFDGIPARRAITSQAAPGKRRSSSARGIRATAAIRHASGKRCVRRHSSRAQVRTCQWTGERSSPISRALSSATSGVHSHSSSGPCCSEKRGFTSQGTREPYQEALGNRMSIAGREGGGE